MINYLNLAILTVLLLLPVQVYAGHEGMVVTDQASSALFSFIDLRDRETFVQVTNTDSNNQTLHVQIFNVDQNCNENNFFDVYTPNDTHIYNMRDILTNDGNPSGVVLPDDAYGFVVVSALNSSGDLDDELDFLIGNFRILDNAGYEYRTNSAGENEDLNPDEELKFNFSTKNGVTLSDVVMIVADNDPEPSGEWKAVPTEDYWAVDVDIFDANEIPFSCRDVTFSCVDEDNPLLEDLLETAETSVAAFEYGINEAIPHSRDGELLCPGNTISDGWVFLDRVRSSSSNDKRAYFIGLNNGNGRGTIDSIWRPACVASGRGGGSTVPTCED